MTGSEAPFSLEDRYRVTAGRIYLSGVQALVRLPVDQRRRDVREGRDTAAFISGYEGSPLAGYDLQLARQSALLDEHGIVFTPGLNEELAADAVQGSQLASLQPDRRVSGVTGYWYGKAPGLDRATDALRHANLGGTSPEGGAVAFVGDDATAKSSTVPSSSEPALAELGMPTLVPTDPQEILDLGQHAVALSRFTGLWVALKIATNVADGSGSALVGPDRVSIALPDNQLHGKPYVHTPSAAYIQPHLATLEQSLLVDRLELARRYAAANRLNIIDGGPADRIGIVAAGSTYLEVRQALDALGLPPEVARRRGVRLLKLAMVFPIDPAEVREFANGLSEIVVVEDKRAFIETALKEQLYGVPGAPSVHGRTDPRGRPLLHAGGELTADQIAVALAARLAEHDGFDDVAARPTAPLPAPLPLATRTPFFCSGCPHNRSTQVPAGSLVGAGIGCAGMAMLMPPERTGNVIGLTQMGGEGGAWIGMQPFVATRHLFQNLGDGTFHHSGSLAVRAAVAAGATITFKLLYNGAVAMTGGQPAVGGMSVPDLTRALAAEGVAKIVITTDEPRRYKRVSLAPGTAVAHRDKLLTVQEELAGTQGVTVLIHDQECATELRRKRKRGSSDEPTQRAFINERVCEGCGDCGRKSNCLSVRPVETEYGRKTRIHQDSCNKDFSCLDGDCPAFLSVVPGKRATHTGSGSTLDVHTLPEVTPAPPDRFAMRIAGIGGTGVVTLAQIAATAAAMDGLHVRALDQTGLAQKGGSVVSDLKMSSRPVELAHRLGAGECDLFLGCDLLVAASPGTLAVADAGRTLAVVSTSEVPTGAMVTDPAVRFPSAPHTLRVIAERARPGASRFVDAERVTTALFGDTQYANMFLLGVAYQLGALPLRARTLETAIGINGVAVELNRQAFRRGRQLVADPDGLQRAIDPRADDSTTRPTTLTERVQRRTRELVAYQNQAYAAGYAAFVEQVADAEAALAGGSTRVAETVAEQLFKLMAYKDEYEVARLSLDPDLRSEIHRQFGPGARYAYRLHPPVLRSLGMRRKLSLDSRFRIVFAALYRMRRLRGTPFDPFGHTEVRRTERQLIGQYKDLIERSLAHLTEDTLDAVVAIAALPDRIRGYENVKLANVADYRAEAGLRLRELTTQLADTGD